MTEGEELVKFLKETGGSLIRGNKELYWSVGKMWCVQELGDKQIEHPYLGVSLPEALKVLKGAVK